MQAFGEREPIRKFWQLDRWGAPIVGILVVVLVLAGISASRAETADDRTEQELAEACSGHECDSQHDGRWGHPQRGHRFFGRRGHDPEAAKEHMQYATGWMLKRLDVDNEIQERIQARLSVAFDELVPLFEEHEDTRDDWLEAVLGSNPIDRQGLEERRRSTMTSADRASQILTGTIADVAEMLTPEQRAEIAERIRRHHH